MKRSRVTFATMRGGGDGRRGGVAVDDGALLEAEVRDAEAVDRHIVPGCATPRSASRRAARFVRCRPRSSMPCAQRETTQTLSAVRSTTG
jgi:hypothetical protein